jgi:hypothetical protein
MEFSQKLKTFSYFSYFLPSVFNFFNICDSLEHTCIWHNHEKKIEMSNVVEFEGFDFVFIFSSPELKAQVSYSDRRLSVCKLLHSDIFSRTTVPILTRLGTDHLWGRGFKFVQMKGIAFLQGEIIAKV